MSIHYQGSGLSNFHEQPGANWSQDDLNMFSYKVRMGGVKAQLDTYLATIPLGGSLSGFANMKLVSITPSINKAFAFVDLEYYGYKSSLPSPVITPRTSDKVSTITVDTPSAEVDNFGSYVSKETVYRGPEVVYRYVTTSEQTSPNYAGDSRDTQIIRVVITGENGTKRPQSAPASVATALATTDSWVNKSLDSKPVLNTNFWVNTEVNAKEFPSNA